MQLHVNYNYLTGLSWSHCGMVLFCSHMAEVRFSHYKARTTLGKHTYWQLLFFSGEWIH